MVKLKIKLKRLMTSFFIISLVLITSHQHAVRYTISIISNHHLYATTLYGVVIIPESYAYRHCIRNHS